MRATYPAEIKLKQKSLIDTLFSKGKWKTSGAVRVIFLKSTAFTSPKVGVSVSKKNFKRAVDRNRIKRLLRECYRLNKTTFHTAFGENATAMIFYNSKEKPAGYREVLQDFMQLCEKSSPPESRL